MKRLCAIGLSLLFLTALAGACAETQLRFSVPDAPCTAYTETSQRVGRAERLLAVENDSVTVELTAVELEKVLKILEPTLETRYTVEGVRVTDGYSPNLDGAIKLNGKRYNFQLAVSRDRILLGIPVIVGGY